MPLGFLIAVAVAWASSYSSNSIGPLALESPHALGAGLKEKKKKKKKAICQLLKGKVNPHINDDKIQNAYICNFRKIWSTG